MNPIKETIHQMVEGLPEVYQPIFGHDEFSGLASRSTSDRLQNILEIHDRLAQTLKRPLKVLDLGCAQGFIGFKLAERGANVVGVDFLPANVALCRALASENPELEISFIQASIQEFVPSLNESYDIILMLSVIHHVAHADGMDKAINLTREVRRRSTVQIIELAVKEEPLYWAASLPDDPLTMFENAGFVKVLAYTRTHLSDIVRPLYFVSESLWFVGGLMGAYQSVLHGGHRFAADSLKKSRTYYLSEDRIVKKFSISGEDADVNSLELKREADVLRQYSESLELPMLIYEGMDDCYAWLVREKLPGEILSEIIDRGEAVDKYIVIRDVLRECIKLERAGLYHQDVRIWNIIKDRSGCYRLIDYGAFSSEKRDCLWPGNIYISFLFFVKELLKAPDILSEPIREIAVTPFGFPGHLSGWVERLSGISLKDWTFERMLDELEACFLDPATVQVEPKNALECLLRTLEEAISALARYERTTRTSVESALVRVKMESDRISDIYYDSQMLAGEVQRIGEQVKKQDLEISSIKSSLDDISKAVLRRIEEVERLSSRGIAGRLLSLFKRGEKRE